MKPPTMIPVANSSNIVGICYTSSNKTLFVAFSYGVVYSYHPVEKEVYDEIMASDSIGQKFNELVKNNKEISYKKLESEKK